MIIEFWSFTLTPLFAMQYKELHDSRAIFVFAVLKKYLKKIKYAIILIIVQIVQKLFFNIITMINQDFQNGSFARSCDQLAAIIQSLIMVYLMTYEKKEDSRGD